MEKNSMDDFLFRFVENLWWGIQDGGLSMFLSIGNFIGWIFGALAAA